MCLSLLLAGIWLVFCDSMGCNCSFSLKVIDSAFYLHPLLHLLLSSLSFSALGRDHLRLMSDGQIGSFGKAILWQKLL